MKPFIKEYLGIFLYTICGLLIIISSYNIIINTYHSMFLNDYVTVREIDNNFLEYKKSVLSIENLLVNKKSNTTLYNALSKVLLVLKREGVYRLLPGDKLSYYDVYKINNYFIDTIINESWIGNLKLLINDKIVDNYVNSLINSANYLNKELLNNSNFHYDVGDNSIKNALEDEYNLVINNYKNYALLILELCSREGDVNA